MADNKATIENPSEEAERALLEVILDKTEEVKLGGNTYRIGALRKGTRLKVSEVLLNAAEKEDSKEEKEDHKLEDKVMAKCAAAYILNSFWSIRFLGGLVWSVYWRWLYYVKQYTDSDYYELLQLCKKKAEKQTSAYMMNIMLLTATRTTTMTMTRKEVKRIHLEKSTEQLGVQQKNSLN